MYDLILPVLYHVHISIFQQGRKLYFEDGVRRIDYILSWSTKKDEKEKDEHDTESSNKKKKYREAFEKNLEIEGLHLEYDIKVTVMHIHFAFI